MAIGAIMFRNRVLAIALAGLVVATPTGSAQDAKIAVTCTNLISGTSWQISIDFDKATVDSNRAKISDAKIAWFDPVDGSNNTLDRKSGDLTAIISSSTGGYFRHASCGLEKSR